MLQYILRRLLLAIPTLFGVSVLSFVVMNLAPGDYMSTLAAQLAQMGVELCVHLRPSRIPAGDLVGLKPGDVLRLDHTTDEPALGAVRGIDLFTGSIGTRGRHLGFRVTSWRNDD